ncbi:outer membrane protein [Pelobacter propionicus]|uniref:Surface antigen msp4 family protein n=1 Tax=Pelobacter propionicus (strain DSM 2379 / NBRC 103807 / OttBd1) TaxID=338966 RepID=A1ASC0_PELPD|nr:outer membrane beta-barrel protein [Pelobacter propionicus]ABL00241.1 surface antigen msp4 family protein [Pelobacter propionicus DSM 2379]
MKRNMIIVAALATLLIPSLARAEPPRPGPYVSWFVGVTVPQDRNAHSYDSWGSYNDRVEFDPGIDVGGSAGYDFGYVRLEGELSYKGAEIDSVYDATSDIRYHDLDGSLSAFAVMANCYFDLHNDTPVTPYLGGGIGFATLYLDDTSGVSNGVRWSLYDSDDDTVFAYQIGAGIDISINRYFSLDVGYRYFATDKGKFDEGNAGTRMKFESHNATLGLRFKF